jgi:hypothetical protein
MVGPRSKCRRRFLAEIWGRARDAQIHSFGATLTCRCCPGSFTLQNRPYTDWRVEHPEVMHPPSLLRKDRIDFTARFEECRLVAVSPRGEEAWVSNPVPGACSGDPKVSSDDAYVYINSNNALSDGSIAGQFNIFRFGVSQVFFQSTPRETPRPFGPLGMFRSPSTGPYTGGAGNTNDLLVWSNSLGLGETEICCGGTWAFQFPTGEGPLSIKTLLPNNAGNAAAPGWYSNTAPVLYNAGTNVVFSVSRSQFRTWINPDPFDLRATNRNSVDYETSRPPIIGTIASVALSSDPLTPQIYGPVAGPQLVSMNSDLTPLWEFTTTSAVLTQPKVAPDDSRVYFSTENGNMYSVLADGTPFWTVSVGATIQSGIGLSADGATLYYGTNDGNIVAWTVAGLPPTPAPTNLQMIIFFWLILIPCLGCHCMTPCKLSTLLRIEHACPRNFGYPYRRKTKETTPDGGLVCFRYQDGTFNPFS